MTNVRTNILKGTAASPGTAKGKVKVIHDASEITKMKKGDVLVAKMTSPDFTIGMGKAAAIITDEGGLSSHAAIVSREFGIPCIVGVKGITSVLKNGEHVEVDADKGIVRKL